MANVYANPNTRTVYLDEPPVDGVVTLDVVTDIYSQLKDDWLASEVLFKLRFPFRSFGDLAGVNRQIGPYVFFDNVSGWRLKPYDADYELYLAGNLIGESAVQQLTLPLWEGRVGRSISIFLQTSNQALTVLDGLNVLTVPKFLALK